MTQHVSATFSRFSHAHRKLRRRKETLRINDRETLMLRRLSPIFGFIEDCFINLKYMVHTIVILRACNTRENNERK